MALLSKEVNRILKLINEDTCGSLLTFEQISIQFQQGIPKSSYLNIGNILVLLLQNQDLIPTPQQRLIILYLVIEMYKCEQQQTHMNPFASILLYVLQPTNQIGEKHLRWNIPPTKQESSFVSLLINDNHNNHELLRKTPNQILQSNLFSNEEHLQELRDRLYENLKEKIKQLPISAQCHLSAVINDPELNNYGFDFLLNDPQQQSSNIRETIEQLLLNNAMKKTIHPEYLRLVPPLQECVIDELVWLSPPMNADLDGSLFSWDSSLCLTNTNNFEIRQLMNKLYRSAINLHEQEKLQELLNNDPDLIYHIGLEPSKLPLLVEHNPAITTYLLSKLDKPDQINGYLETLLTMNVSLHSLEVVNRLTTSMKLPKEFFDSYVLKSMKVCEETKSIYSQTRLVRLVSVFIQSLLRNKTIDIKYLRSDIHKFLSHFRNTKEITDLSQCLKTLDLHNEDNDDAETKQHDDHS